nr:tegument protein VP22 UL49 [Psittacid alphaherpesvirus 6]
MCDSKYRSDHGRRRSVTHSSNISTSSKCGHTKQSDARTGYQRRETASDLLPDKKSARSQASVMTEKAAFLRRFSVSPWRRRRQSIVSVPDESYNVESLGDEQLFRRDDVCRRSASSIIDKANRNKTDSTCVVTKNTVWQFDLGDKGTRFGSTKWKPMTTEFNKQMFVGSVAIVAQAHGSKAAKQLWDLWSPATNDELRDMLKRVVVKVQVYDDAPSYNGPKDICEYDDARPVRRERGRSTLKRSDCRRVSGKCS